MTDYQELVDEAATTRTRDGRKRDGFDRSELEAIVLDACRKYIRKRRRLVTPFVDRHFTLKGSAKIHKKAFGKDVLRAPVNVAWAIPYMVVKGAGFVARKVRWKKLARTIDRLKPGLATDVQREVEWLIYTELLELPYKQRDRKSEKDALLGEILRHPRISRYLDRHLRTIHKLSESTRFRKNLEKNLLEYTSGRFAASEVTSSLLVMAAGYVAARHITPGAVSLGTTVASSMANSVAISNFFAGEALGTLYYGVFPAAQTTALVAGSVAFATAVLAVAAAFAGVFTDPVQRLTGRHHKKLHKLIDAVEVELLGNKGRASGQGGFKTYDRYIARLIDLIDIAAGLAKA